MLTVREGFTDEEIDLHQTSLISLILSLFKTVVMTNSLRGLTRDKQSVTSKKRIQILKQP